MLLISAGRGTEAKANEAMHRRGGELWNLPEASHAAALRTEPGRATSAGSSASWTARCAR